MTKLLRTIFVLAAFGALTACGGTFSAPLDLERGNGEMVGGGGGGGTTGAAGESEGGPGGQPR